MLKLDGKALAKAREKPLAVKISQPQDLNSSVGFAVILVGDNPASEVYVRNKMKACKRVGIHSKTHHLPKDVSEEELRLLILELNKDPAISGMLVQLPLPQHLNKEKVLSWLDPTKDADGLSLENTGLMWAGRPRVLPCTPHGVMKILDHYQVPTAGQHAVIVGRSQIVGLPMAYLLQKANATVTICHSHTRDLAQHTRQADILVVAAGQPRFLGADYVKEGATVIDVGIHHHEGRLCGDVRYEELEGVASAATPVPGGVGPMTISMLLENTYELARLSHKRP